MFRTSWLVEELSDSATGEPAGTALDNLIHDIRLAWSKAALFNETYDGVPYFPFREQPGAQLFYAVDGRLVTGSSFQSYCPIPGLVVKQDYKPLSIHARETVPPAQFGIFASANWQGFDNDPDGDFDVDLI